MRTNQARKTGPALLDRPVTAEAMPRAEQIRRAPSEPLRARREYPGVPSNNDFDPDDTAVQRNRGRGRRIRRGLIPQTRTGRIVAGVALAVVLAAVAAGCYKTNQFLRHDPRFRIASSSDIELQGNVHLSRSQLLSIFGEDVDGNLFAVPLRERRDELEQMPWVEHATVMRLLPNRLRVDVVERTPVAFVRQGSSIGMADRSGVLLDIPPDAPGNPNYSFPVVTGLKAEDAPELREQRMHLYSAFLRDLDSTGKKVSTELSEVDLSDPEDLKALLPSGNGAETLVHFGTGNFLHRYQRFEDHIAEWRTQYPRLSSVDMRYERQVVLQMPPKDSTVPTASAEAPEAKLVTPRQPSPTVHADSRQKPQDTQTMPHKVVAVVTPKPVVAAKAKPVTAPTVAPVASTTRPAIAPKLAPSTQASNAAAAKQADIARRVAKIKEWMAQRQKARGSAVKR
jgi:cell division protein FtsQ